MALEGVSGTGTMFQTSSPNVDMRQETHIKVENEDNNNIITSYKSVNKIKELASNDINSNADDSEDVSNEKQLGQSRQIKKAVEDLNKSVAGKESEAVFGIHEQTNRVTIKIVNKKTKEVIKEFPPEKTLDMIAKVWEMAGIMVDEKR